MAVGREWRSLLDAQWTARDQSAMLIGMLWLTPITVWLHEWGHAATMRLYGVADPQIHFFLYWGYVTGPEFPVFSPWQQLMVSLAGPVVSYVLGVVLLAVALLVPLRPALALALAACALMELSLILLWYPLYSLIWGWGDFEAIYHSAYPAAGLVVGAVNVVSLVGLAWLMKRPWMQGFLGYPHVRPWRLQWHWPTPPGDSVA